MPLLALESAQVLDEERGQVLRRNYVLPILSCL
jgi:hypothetical protein